MENKELVVLIGVAGSGKSAYAKQLNKEEYNFISFDNNCNYSAKTIDYENLKRLANKDKNVIDGYIIGWDMDLKLLTSYFNDYDIKIRLVFCSKEELIKRKIKRANIIPENLVKRYLRLLMLLKDFHYFDCCILSEKGEFVRIERGDS